MTQALVRGTVRVAAAVAALALVAAGCGGDDGGASGDPGPVHVHGLGIDPADGALYIATHTGLFRVGADERTPTRVGELFQDTMGFIVVGPKRFLGSGHPDLREAQARGLPPHLGLVESRDGGLTWQSVSLLGEADFHVLRHAHDRIYGYDVLHERLLASRDGGRSWEQLPTPGRILDFEAHPESPSTLVAVAGGGEADGLFLTRDGGVTWTRVAGTIGLLAWPAPARLYVVRADGTVLVSEDGGATARVVGDVSGEPAALLAAGPEELLVALHDGTVQRSADGGATWSVRSSP
ncbi:MAG TPA: hypothetical protein VM290_05845 [Gaiellaceae bacterium]|nr:hypothetical protein [Gaiellaceae bacterium]